MNAHQFESANDERFTISFPSVFIDVHWWQTPVSRLEKTSSLDWPSTDIRYTIDPVGMLEFSDKPYTFYPPKLNPLIKALANWFNRHRYLPGEHHRITVVHLSGSEPLLQLKNKGRRRILFLANHPSHSDPQILTEAQYQLGIPSAYMAAYDVFERSRFQAWVMQRCGAFSVDREASDSRSMKTAGQILQDGRHALSIFPEGNVYLTNDRVTPFLEGAAYLAVRTQKKLKDDQPIHLIPTSIKLSYSEDCREKVLDQFREVARGFEEEWDEETDLLEEVRRVGLSGLQRLLKQRGFADAIPVDGPLTEKLPRAATAIIAELENKMDLKPRERDSLIDRIRNIRRNIHQIRLDPERELDHRIAHVWNDEAILAYRILTYDGDYLAEKQTLDRVAETSEKLLEDLRSEAMPPHTPRQAWVHFGDPIDIRKYSDARARTATQELTRQVESAVQTGVDVINEKNDLPGSERFNNQKTQ